MNAIAILGLLGVHKNAIVHLGEQEVKQLAGEKSQAFLEGKKPGILATLKKDGRQVGTAMVTMKDGRQYTQTQAAVRESLLLCFKAIFRSGFIADKWRDAYDDKVMALVDARSPSTLEDLLQFTIEGLAQQAF